MKSIEEILKIISENYPDYVITFFEFEYANVVGVRISTFENVVSVIKCSEKYSLDDALLEAFRRIQCKERGCNFESREREIEKATDVLKMTLQEIGFDRAVSLLEKLNNF